MTLLKQTVERLGLAAKRAPGCCKSVGFAAEDCLTASEVLARAKALGIGDETTLI